MNLFQWQFPAGPGDPFGDPTLVVLDSLRVLIVVCGILTILLAIPAIAMSWNISQKYRLLCISFFSLYVTLTEVQRIGDHANWRLLLGTTGAIWAVTSLFSFIRFEGNPETAKWASWLRRREIRHQEEGHDHNG